MNKYITVHCSATKPDHDVQISDIRKWHMDRGFNDVGYHYLITRGGEVQTGRSVAVTGAHTKGHNTGNIGICMAGGVDNEGKPADNYTEQQYGALRYIISLMVSINGIPEENIKGHRDWPDVAKACPCFDVQQKLAEWKE